MTEYALRLSDEERARYRMMAQMAQASEAADWQAAGVVAGAAVVDVGCGPGAVLRVLAEAVGPDGRAVGVDADAGAVALAAEEVAGLPQARTAVGRADDCGLEEGSFDVAMCRHVLAHNGQGADAIVAHLATLVRPGGAVYAVDVDLTAIRMYPESPELTDLADRYTAFLERRGGDPRIGMRLGALLQGAGLELEAFRAPNQLFPVPPGLRPPPWAARDAMVAEGAATAEDVARWGAAFEALDAAPERPWIFVPVFVAVGRRR
jgi:SAM-dependent methyltransferase